MTKTIVESSRNAANEDQRDSSGNYLGCSTDIPFVCTKQELARALRVTTRHIDNLTRRRLLRATRLGRSVRYTRTAVLKALETLGASF